MTQVRTTPPTAFEISEKVREFQQGLGGDISGCNSTWAQDREEELARVDAYERWKVKQHAKEGEA